MEMEWDGDGMGRRWVFEAGSAFASLSERIGANWLDCLHSLRRISYHSQFS